ncbi:MAG: hypothetical protein V1800_06960 [Candidatus Latescibacterota bacterium]
MDCASLLALSKAVASYRTPKDIAAQEQRRIIGEFMNHAGHTLKPVFEEKSLQTSSSNFRFIAPKRED